MFAAFPRVSPSSTFVGSCRSAGLGSSRYTEGDVSHDIPWKCVVNTSPNETDDTFTNSTKGSILLSVTGSVMASMGSALVHEDIKGGETSRVVAFGVDGRVRNEVVLS
jgi:hypothetical protein